MVGMGWVDIYDILACPSGIVSGLGMSSLGLNVGNFSGMQSRAGARWRALSAPLAGELAVPGRARQCPAFSREVGDTTCRKTSSQPGHALYKTPCFCLLSFRTNRRRALRSRR